MRETTHGPAQFVVGVLQQRDSRRCGVLGPGRRTRYEDAAGGSGPILCWKRRWRIVELRRWGWNPNGAGNPGSCAALNARSATRALSIPSRVRTAPTSATHRSSCSGSNPMTRSSAWWTSSTRRWTQRIAPARPTGSRRNALAAALRLGARSACATTASTCRRYGARPIPGRRPVLDDGNARGAPRLRPPPGPGPGPPAPRARPVAPPRRHCGGVARVGNPSSSSAMSSSR